MDAVLDAGVVDDGDAVDLAVAVIRRALDLVDAACPGEGTARLNRRLGAFERVARMVEAHVVGVVGVVGDCDRSGAFFDDGHGSARSWVAAETNSSTAEGLARARCARLVAACPVVGDQLAAGRVGVAQVRELARTRANPRVGHLLDGVVEEMLTEARTLPLHTFTTVVRDWEALVDADGAHREHDAAHRDRRLHAWGDGRGGELWGRFAADQFAELTEILDAYADAELAADVEQARAGGDETAPLPRTPEQRRADALVQALRDAAASSSPAADAGPTVNYVIPADVFDEQLAAMVAHRRPRFDATSLRWRGCATTSGVPVDPAAVVAAALVGHVRRVVIDGEGRIIDFGHRRRLFTGAAREAALLQAVLDSGDGRCLWPGCGRRRNCQVDHTAEWQGGGVTDLRNSGLLCARHNRVKSHGFTVWRDPDGRWHVRRPDGTEIAPAA